MIAHSTADDLSSLSAFGIGLVSSVPWLGVALGMWFNSQHSDATQERSRHVGIPLAIGALALICASSLPPGLASLALLFVSGLGLGAAQGVFWSIPTYAELILEKISLYVKASKPRAVVVTGCAATHSIEVSGRRLAEPLMLATACAEATAEALARLGVDRKLIRVTADGDPRPLLQLHTPGLEASKRRVTVRNLNWTSIRGP